MQSFNALLKRIAARLPGDVQSDLKRLRIRRQLRKGRFRTDELEYDLLDRWVRDGDWVIDVGANIGCYAARLSELVGPEGRVIAFEPVPATFELLAGMAARLRHRNVTLLNVAASEQMAALHMTIPKFDTGLDNYYMATVTEGAADLRVLSLSIDSLEIPDRVSLVKVDAEGYDLHVLKGMRKLIERDRPVLIVESGGPELEAFLADFGYAGHRLDGSSNEVYEAAPDGVSPAGA